LRLKKKDEKTKSKKNGLFIDEQKGPLSKYLYICINGLVEKKTDQSNSYIGIVKFLKNFVANVPNSSIMNDNWSGEREFSTCV